MKVAVSIPDRVFRTADELAARLGVSRSQLYAEALAALVEKHREDVITSRLNEVYGPGGEASALEPDVVDLQSRSLELQRW
jgi:metal-responsive CopG/Arc/MetJ family transcriptional regulator